MKSYLIIFFALLVYSLSSSTNASAQMRMVHVDTLREGSDISEMSFYSPTEGFVAFGDWIGFTIDSGRTFIERPISANVNFNGYAVNLIYGFRINGLVAFNSNRLIVYGDYGLVPSILYSNDGGITYTLVYHSQFSQFSLDGGISSMHFPGGGNIGYATDPDRILKTVDGGLNWSVLRTIAGSFLTTRENLSADTLVFFGNGTGLNRRLIKSVNGGASFTNLNIPGDAVHKLGDVFFLNSQVGWLSKFDANFRGYLYKTTNGGINWTKLNDENGNPFIGGRMHFFNEQLGYVIVGDYRVLKTSNGGVLWEPLPRDNQFSPPNKILKNFWFQSADQFWVAGGGGFIELTTNGGGTPLPKAYFKNDTTGVSRTDNVALISFSNPTLQHRWYVNNVFVSNSYNTVYTHNITRYRDTIMLIVSNGTVSDTLIKEQVFNVPVFPVITSFSPASGSLGTFVEIRGQFFTRVPVVGVKFGGTSASSFTILSDTTATAVVGNGTTGSVSMSDGRHLFESAINFIYFPVPAASPPVVTAIQPVSGPVGTPVVISGSNFGTDNIVYFGAVRATVQSSTNNQINCTVPPGATYKPVTVLNTSTHLSGASANPFTVTFSDSSNFNKGSFISAYEIDISNAYPFRSPMYIMARDLNNDGKPDLLVKEYGSTLSSYRNTSSGGNILLGDRVVVGQQPPNDQGKFDVNDIDGDGKPDIVSASNRPYFFVLRNNSTPDSIAFGELLRFSVSGDSQEPVLADLDNDGRNDVAMVSFGNRKLSVFRNTSSPGNVSLAKALEYTCGGFGNVVTAGDVDNDGKMDLVALCSTNGDSSFISYFHNTSTVGNISFDNPVNIRLKGYLLGSEYISVVDYDGDGKRDIVALNSSEYIHLLRNTGSIGNFLFDSTGNHLLKTSVPRTGNIDNISGDTQPDLMFGEYGGSFSLVENTSTPGSPLIESPVDMPYYGAYDIDAGDFDLDGKIDIVASTSQYKNISIFKNSFGQSTSSSICSGAGTSFVSDLPGTTYQWQEDTGTGFTNITNNYNFSGITSNTLQLSRIPTSWCNYKYRCVIDGRLYSQSFSLRFSNQWTGRISNDWHNSSNWTCDRVPDEFTDVIITARTVQVNADVICRSLTISRPGVLVVATGVHFQVLH